jgi:hypothetical protein
MPAPQATHVDPVLTQISVDFKNADYVGKELFPVAPVDFPGGKYAKFSTKNKHKIQRSLISANSRAPMVEWDMTFDTYSADYHGFAKPVSEIARQWAASGVGRSTSLEVYTTEFVKNMTLLEYEYLVATKATTAGTYSGQTDTPNTKWDADGATPISDVKDAASSMAVAPNMAIIPKPVFDVLSENSAILDRIKYVGGGGFVTAEILAQVFNLDKVVVAKARETFGGDYIWGENMVLAYVAPQVGPEIVTFGLTFSPDGEDFIRNYTDDTIGRGAQVIESHWAYDINVVAAQAGFLLSSVLT